MDNKSEEVKAHNNGTGKNEKRKKKNVAIICLAFVCVFTSSNAVNNLQSSINVDGEVGIYSLAFLAAGSMFASVLLTTPLIFIFGYKWTIMTGQIAILVYIAANMYPIAALLYPSKYRQMKCGTISQNLLFSLIIRWYVSRNYVDSSKCLSHCS
jgi:hypothetical protein